VTELIIDRDERLRLRARAHHLHPVVLLGSAGLTEAVIRETDRALAAHGLIKVRVPGDDRAEREAIGAELAQRLGAARVQAIGKLLVLYRPRPEDTEAEGTRSRGAGARPAKVAPKPQPAARKAAPKPVSTAPRSRPRGAPAPARPRRASRPAGRRGGGRPR